MGSNRDGNFVILDQCHADSLFPEPGREGLRAACHEMLESGPCMVILKEGEFKVQPLKNAGDVVDLSNVPQFPWRVRLAEAAIARALGEFFEGIDPLTIEVDPTGVLDRLDDPDSYQPVKKGNCVRVPVTFKMPGNGDPVLGDDPVLGFIQLSVFMQGGLLTFQIGGQPAGFKPLGEGENVS